MSRWLEEAVRRRGATLISPTKRKANLCPLPILLLYFLFLLFLFLSFFLSSFIPTFLSLSFSLSLLRSSCTSRLARPSHSPRDPRPVHQPVIDDPPHRPRSPEDRAVCYRVTTFHEPVSSIGGFPRIARAFESRGKRGRVFETFFPKEFRISIFSKLFGVWIYRVWGNKRIIGSRGDFNVIRWNWMWM